MFFNCKSGPLTIFNSFDRKKNCLIISLNIFLSNFFYIVTKATPQFFSCLFFTSFNSIYETNNQVCVLGAINEGYESLVDVNMYVCMCLKVNVVYMIVGIFNLEGKKNCIIGSKVTIILPTSF